MTDESHNADVPPEPHEESAHDSLEQVGQTMANLKSVGDSGANWFFWIAGLSLVNTAITHSGGGRTFVIGLAITAIVDFIASELGKQHPDHATGLMIFAIAFSVFISIIVLLFGWLSRRRLQWIFGIGMFLYLLDGLIYLLLGVFWSAAFHGYALFSMIQGFNAYRNLNRIEKALHSADFDEAEEESHPDRGFEPA